MSLTYNLKGKGICTVIINNRIFYLKIQELTVPLVKFFSDSGKLSMKCEAILMFHMGQKLFSFSQETKEGRSIISFIGNVRVCDINT